MRFTVCIVSRLRMFDAITDRAGGGERGRDYGVAPRRQRTEDHKNPRYEPYYTGRLDYRARAEIILRRGYIVSRLGRARDTRRYIYTITSGARAK